MSHRTTDTTGEGPAAGRGVVEGAFALLDALRRRGGEAGLSELAAACGVPKGTAHRLLDQLGPVGAVERRGRRYALGPQLFRLGQSWQPYPGLTAAARPALHRLRAATGASVLLAVLRDEHALTVVSVPGRAESVLPVRDGMAFPLGSAPGRPLVGRDPGPSVDRNGPAAGLTCVALPVRGPDRRVVASLAALTPADGNVPAVVTAVASAATSVAAGLARSVSGERAGLAAVSAR
ncbi:helix-turn-helix domain-containing protein [Streptomyces sp. NPDC051921]|uniref:IclR family transcriptional regulator n=1 Tax=Streptomyces sp. NPDC051921 TaxID=3155806 RepID=UPI0034131679